MAWSDAFTKIVETVQEYLVRRWGPQTFAQADLEAAAEAALERAKNAQSADELNGALADLQRLFDEALARKRHH